MSSLRNAIRRKVHKERPQPAARAKVGFLEKKVDYKERADDHHRKEKALQRLREKAALRNPDEFYFGMRRTKLKDGVHEIRKGRQHSAKELKRATEQDMAYVQRKRDQERKRVAKMRDSMHCLDAGQPANTHTVFVDSEREVAEFRPDEFFDTAPGLVDRAHNRVRRAELDKAATVADLPSAHRVRKAERARAKRYRELAARMKRKRRMEDELEQLQTRKNLQGRGKRAKIVVRDRFGDIVPEKTSYKWSKERKK